MPYIGRFQARTRVFSSIKIDLTTHFDCALIKAKFFEETGIWAFVTAQMNGDPQDTEVFQTIEDRLDEVSSDRF